jgi:hypothetical protein
MRESGMDEHDFWVLAGRCGGCGCGCPAIMEAANGEDVVIIGDAAAKLLTAAEVRGRIGDGEAAVVISKALLLEALETLERR